MNNLDVTQSVREGRDFSGLKASGATMLASLLYVLLLDAAFEAIRNHSPVRLWVAVVTSVYLGGTAVIRWRKNSLWQRLGWPVIAMITFFVLLALLTFTAWLSGGLSNGLTLLGLPTSTLLSLVTIAGIILSGTLLFRANYPHWAFKWAVAALSCYSVVAFLLGIFGATSFADMFHGQGFWTKVPVPLQGAIVGALVLIPATLVYETAATLKRPQGNEHFGWQSRYMGKIAIPVLVASLLLAIAGLTQDPNPILPEYAPKKATAVIKAVSLSSSSTNKLEPMKVSAEFSYGVREVVVWYRWRGAENGHRIVITWFKDELVLLEQGESLEAPSGSASWFLARYKGEPLPVGDYRVELLENGELVTALPFRIRGE